ncbi:MAG TPA: hypothetical protein VFG20_17935, partial [Planctomycetaceae bacterium]|nr:hypothetical protein [Planctomycetaceae bacterium]
MFQRWIRHLRLPACLAAGVALGMGAAKTFAADAGTAPVWQRVTAKGESHQAILLKSDRLT